MQVSVDEHLKSIEENLKSLSDEKKSRFANLRAKLKDEQTENDQAIKHLSSTSGEILQVN